MKRFHHGKGTQVEDTTVDAFLNEVLEVCRKHGMSISHEDEHGSFLVKDFDEAYALWLMRAAIDK